MPPIRIKYPVQVYPPLAGDNPPVVPEPEPEPARLSRRQVLARLWYICFASVHGAVLWTLLTAPEEYCTSPVQPIGGWVAPFVLWGVTILVWCWARNQKEAS